jgi:succinate dehydrogenase / fumarate reductase iron-sulfur subunit
MDAAACIGCGACVAPARTRRPAVHGRQGHAPGLLPQGQAERTDRVRKMVAPMDAEGFGSCTNHGECEAACPKGISIENIALLNRDYIKAALAKRPERAVSGD